MFPLADDMRKLMDIDAELSLIGDLDILLERILLEARTMVRADAGSIYVREGNELIVRITQNETQQRKLPKGRKLIYAALSVPITKETLSGYVAETRESLNIPDVYAIPESAPYSFDDSYDRVSNYKTVSALTLPLITSRGEILGVLQVINPLDYTGKCRAFDADAERLVRHFALNAAAALHRAFMTRTILMRMTLMAHMRDPKETGAHVNRVAAYAVEIYDHWALHKNISIDEREKTRDILRMASMLHDVGKVAIPDTILKKASSFTQDERLVMRTHAFRGSQLFVNPQSELDDMAAEIALRHHENWDGSGYPGIIDPQTGLPITVGQTVGLKGEEIPLFARITAVADVYDALCTERAYKKAWCEEDVFAEIRSLSGKKFDPELVEIFFEILPEIRQVAMRYSYVS